MKISFSRSTQQFLLLSLASGILLGCSFPPIPFGIIATVAFVPFLFLVERIRTYGSMFRYAYTTFFIFCLVSVYWVGGFTHHKDPYLMLAGGALLLWQPLFFCFPALIYFFIRRKIGLRWGIFSFPFVWITFEWLYALGEFSFPWLTLGNTQTYSLEKIQFIEYTGVYGISLLLLIINILIFIALNPEWNFSLRKKFTLIGIATLLYVLPNFYGMMRHHAPEPSATRIKIGIVQPNTDPWEKWEGAGTLAGRWRLVQSYLPIFDQLKKDSASIVVLPETAILFDIPTHTEHYSLLKKFIDSLDISIVSGYVKTKYYYNNDAPAGSSLIKGTNIFYDSYNAVICIQPNTETAQTYSKMRLVPFAERIPYADKVVFLIEPLRWGVGISNWGIGKDSTIFHHSATNTNFLGMICYESIFPEFVANFVNKGAEYLIFITNDSWWGNTSGARQHNQYAVLRAIENRRWVVRCANGGISSFIDPNGTMYNATTMYTQTSIAHWIEKNSTKTFYTTHGDWLARFCAIVAAIFFVFSIITVFTKKSKRI